ncbi:hypothetical protein GCM10010317_100580 [Streptomyces mirabilis]|nr:hypothetical protein GCM10010317_100580 [Streptomyces mirabilis]
MTVGSERGRCYRIRRGLRGALGHSAPPAVQSSRTGCPAGLFRTTKYPNLPTLAKKTGKTGYIEHCKAARVDDDGKATPELTGSGSAWMELDVLCTMDADGSGCA